MKNIFLIAIFFCILSCSKSDTDYVFKCRVVEKYSKASAENIPIHLKARKNTGIFESKEVDNRIVFTNKNGEAIIEYSNQTDYFTIDVNESSENSSLNYLAAFKSFSDGEYHDTYNFELEPGLFIEFSSDSLKFDYDSIIINIYHQIILIDKYPLSERAFIKPSEDTPFFWRYYKSGTASENYYDIYKPISKQYIVYLELK